ncbi:hypothetical protein KFK09_014635 [Dendrobium nobile]|uniref:Uncharacterized protein n=1 Tax=Dendrobium nobile TaxID=94219 RepID=A0A8T3B2D2_DENNO|nr:hypothetical protein KFK09_014635 [Dendrobium nobile]
MVLSTFVAYYDPSDLHQQTTVFLTQVSCRLQSFRPPSPTMILPTSINRQRYSFMDRYLKRKERVEVDIENLPIDPGLQTHYFSIDFTSCYRYSKKSIFYNEDCKTSTT